MSVEINEKKKKWHSFHKHTHKNIFYCKYKKNEKALRINEETTLTHKIGSVKNLCALPSRNEFGFNIPG